MKSVQEILKFMTEMHASLAERINDPSIDKFVRTELINRADLLKYLYQWIKKGE